MRRPKEAYEDSFPYHRGLFISSVLLSLVLFLLALQQGLGVFWPLVAVHAYDCTLISLVRTHAWEWSFLSCIQCLSITVLLWTRKRTLLGIQGGVLTAWSLLYMFGLLAEIDLVPWSRTGLGRYTTATMFPGRGWEQSQFLTKVVLDPTYTVSYVLGPVLFALGWWILSAFFRHAVDSPLCLFCRYDLTGNTSGTCPECGNNIPRDQFEMLSVSLADRATVLAPAVVGGACGSRAPSASLGRLRQCLQQFLSRKARALIVIGSAACLAIVIWLGGLCLEAGAIGKDESASADEYYSPKRTNLVQQGVRRPLSQRATTGPSDLTFSGPEARFNGQPSGQLTYVIIQDNHSFLRALWPDTAYSSETLRGSIEISNAAHAQPLKKWSGCRHIKYVLKNRLNLEVVKYVWRLDFDYDGQRIANVVPALMASTTTAGWEGSLEIRILVYPSGTSSEKLPGGDRGQDLSRVFVVADYRFRSVLNAYSDQQVFEVRPNGDVLQVDGLPTK
jgi:hypothetical protein